jgi:hypothetical protein
MLSGITRYFGSFADQGLSIPLWEVMLLVLINSICLLFGKHKTGLLMTYLFVFYWGFVFNRAFFTDLMGNFTWGLLAYSILGAGMVLITIVSFFVESK